MSDDQISLFGGESLPPSLPPYSRRPQRLTPQLEAQTCPCCTQTVKLYKRPISGSEARRLIRLYNVTKANPEQEFFHITEFSPPRYNQAADFAKLRYWGLLEEKPNSDVEKRCSGFWRITKKGVAFVELQATVPKYALLFNRHCFGFVGPEQTIKDRLGVKFNYQQLLAGVHE